MSQADPVDVLVDQWRRERPDLDASPLRVVSRLLKLYKHLEASADEALARHGLALWQLDVLASLRRSGPPYALTPTQLMRAATLSSGAITNRVDRLEQAGWVVRVNDAIDRRVTYIHLTAAGRALVDTAFPTRLEQAREVVSLLTPDEAQAVAAALKKLLLHFDPPAAEAPAAIGGNGKRRTRAGGPRARETA